MENVFQRMPILAFLKLDDFWSLLFEYFDDLTF